ncbi:VOC family protein [Gordonia terrae]
MSLHLAHVVLQTAQVAAMRDWYCTVLDAHVVFENGPLCFITFDDEHHRIAFKQLADSGPRTASTPGLHHTAFNLPSLQELSSRYTSLESRGILPARSIQHGVTTSLYYEDPDGNAVELEVDNFSTPEAATDYMEGAEYAGDPLGPFYDPRALVRALSDGVAEAEIMTRQWALANPLPATQGAS